MFKLIRKANDPLYKNSIFLIASSLLGAGTGFIFWVIAARFYSAEDVGLASAAISAIGLISMLSLFGFDITLIRFLPEGKNREELINSCLTISTIFAALLSFVFLAGLDIWAPSLSQLKGELFFSLFLLFAVLSPLTTLQIRSIFVAFRRAEFSFFETIATFMRIFLLPFLVTFGALGIFVAYGATSLLAFFLGYVFMLKLGYSIRLTLRRDIFNEAFHYSAGNYIANIFQSLPRTVLPIMVANILGAKANAYFYVAWVISSLLLAIPVNISFSMLAEGSYKEEELHKITKKALKFIFLLLIPTILLIIGFGNYILLFFGNEYAKNSFNLLRILVLATIPYSISQTYATLKRVQKDVLPIINIYFGIAILTLITSYFLIIEYGIIGVGIGWVIGNFIVATYAGIMIFSRL